MWRWLPSEPSSWWWTFAADAFTAIGTVGAVVVALCLTWRETFRQPRLILKKYPIEPSIVITKKPNNSETRECVVHLLVKNQRPRYAATNCRVNVVAIRERVGSSWHFHHVAVPLQLKWPGIWKNGDLVPTVTVTDEAAVDFGTVVENRSFQLSLYFRPGSLLENCDVSANKTLQFILEVTADNFCPTEQFVAEVHWSGAWIESGKQMEDNLGVIVTPRELPKVSGIGTRT